MPSVRPEAALAAAPQISHERVRFMAGKVIGHNVGLCRALGQENVGFGARGARA
jgi:hypothetical protein